ncbi:MAG TPA: iron-containing alcohol dehydrogenase [Caldisericia bacterium]|nr:iron-containing alcohol dehydrogenase [Caldisericia bacterium]HPO29510.1 iron-containing alcohol dehydrogenase [Caldisericia bacterium]HXK70743.1 iron-containing alcohol dehydrogenase [Caldisericia bacterium]
MENFTFFNPTKVIFGRDVILKLGEEVSKIGKKVLILYGQGSVKKNNVYDKAVKSLINSHITFIELGGIKSNPVLSKVKEAINIARSESVDAIIAIGGGSVIDTAKATAAGYYYNGDIWDAFSGSVKIEKALPIFTVLTISATSSEMNNGAVITNEENNMKVSFFSEVTYPKVSFIDPTIQFSLPNIQVAYGAVDMITHIFELYFNGTPNTEVQDYIATGIVKTILRNTEIILNNPFDYEARAQFVWAGTLALNGINAAGRGLGDWATHKIGHALSAIYDLPHGETLAIVLPAWMRYCMKVDVMRFAKAGREMFDINSGLSPEETAIKGIMKLKDWFGSIGVKTSLVDVGIRVDEIPQIASNPSITYPVGKLKLLNKDDVINILRLANY